MNKRTVLDLFGIFRIVGYVVLAGSALLWLVALLGVQLMPGFTTSLLLMLASLPVLAALVLIAGITLARSLVRRMRFENDPIRR